MSLNGYDISAYQGSIDIAAVPSDFVIIKSTSGTGYLNPNWRSQLAEAKSLGKLVGIYHFARDGYTTATAHDEAQWFIQNCSDVLDGTVVAYLDWEGDNVGDVAYAKAWLDEVTAATGVKPLLYASYATINTYDWSSVHAADYGLWESAYILGYQQINGYQPPAGRAPIPYWGDPAEWQYTSSGQLPGWPNNLDLDLFYGDANTWAAYAAKNGTIHPATSAPVTPLGGFLMSLTDQQQTDLYNRIMGGIPSGDATHETGRLLDVNDLPALAKAVHTYVVPHLDPANGQDDGKGTTLAAMVGARDLQDVATRNAVTSAVAGIHVTLTPADIASIAANVAAAVPGQDPVKLASQLATELGKRLQATPAA